ERLLEPQAIPAELDSGRRLAPQRAPGLLGAPLEAQRDRGEQLSGVERLDPERDPAALRAGDQQQIVREPRQPLDLLRRALQRLAQLGDRVAVAEGELELRPQERERRAQLVPGVRDELALALERVLEAR